MINNTTSERAAFEAVAETYDVPTHSTIAFEMFKAGAAWNRRAAMQTAEPVGLCAPFVGMGKEWSPEASAALDAVLAEYPPERQPLVAAPDRAPSIAPAPSIDSAADAIRAALNEYYEALSARGHGGIAENIAFCKIERAMGMSWDSYKEGLSAIAALQPEGVHHG